MARLSRQSEDPGGSPAALEEERRPIPAAEPRPDWRRGFLVSDGLLILLGLWLMASPTVVTYGTGDETWPPLVAGALIVVGAVLALAGVVPRLVAVWAVFVVAAFLFVAGLALADSLAATWNAAAGGGLAAFLVIAAAAASVADPHGSSG